MNRGEMSTSKDLYHFQPDASINESLKSFRNDMTGKAKLVIKERMPQKIILLNGVLAEKNGYSEFLLSSTQEESETAKRSKSDKQINSLSNVYSFAEAEFNLLKEEVLQMVEMTSTVKLWLQLNVPRIEDGNNFGVSIQSDIVAELSRVEDSALLTLENWTKYLTVRAKMVGKISKHGECPSTKVAYERVLESLDEKQVKSVWIGWLDLRDHYAVLHDLLIKNLEKLINPRSVNTVNMY